MVSPDIFIPGLRLKMMAMSSVKSKLASRIIGYRAGKYLVLEQPILGAMPAAMEDGTNWTISFIHEGTIYAFKTYVLGTCKRPVPLVIVQYPDQIDRTGLRQEQRYPVNIPARIKDKGAEDSFGEGVEGIVLDLSSGGCSVLTLRSFPPETDLELTMSLPRGGEAPISLHSEVRACREVGRDRFRLGLSFVPALAENGYQRLLDFLNEINELSLRI